MSAACAERVNIMRLVDTRWAGIAKGVGVQRIIGRIHMVQVAIENDYLTTSFSVLEEQPMDMLLGLDMLKRHQVLVVILFNIKQVNVIKLFLAKYYNKYKSLWFCHKAFKIFKFISLIPKISSFLELY